jgi:hypothetical protein
MAKARKPKAPSEAEPDKWLLAKDEREKQSFLVKGLLRPCEGCKRLTHVIHLNLIRLCPDCRTKPKTP